MTQKFYKHPINGYKVNDGSKLCIIWAFLFGPIYFAMRGNWGWFFIAWMLAIGTLLTSYFIVPLFARKINRAYLLRQGYIECQR